MEMIQRILLLGVLLCWQHQAAFALVPISSRSSRHISRLASTDTSTSTSTTEAASVSEEELPSMVMIDPKEAVKLFGRLADKYILLDSSGGLCCYSACTDCEYRLPGGGYRMADQSASRPKWICGYDQRNFVASGKQHESKWSMEMFHEGRTFVTKSQFIKALVDMTYHPPLGGPYLGAGAAATIQDTTAAAHLFDLLAGEKEKLTKHRMATRIKELANGEEGWTWAGFSDKMMTTPLATSSNQSNQQ
jgi:hypothetical protein